MIVYLSCGASSAAEYDLPKVGMRVRPPCAALKNYLIFLIRIDLDFLLSLLSGHITAFFLVCFSFPDECSTKQKALFPTKFHHTCGYISIYPTSWWVLLARYESITPSKLHKKFMQIVDDSRFQIKLMIIRSLLQASLYASLAYQLRALSSFTCRRTL